MKSSPTVDQIYTVRKMMIGLTQAEAASLINVTLRSWQWWESGKRAMPANYWELFLFKVNQHPAFRIQARKGVFDSEMIKSLHQLINL